MQIELYDAAVVGFEDPGRAVPLAELSSRTVVVTEGMTVTDLLVAGGFLGASSFAFITQDIARDVREGQPRAVAFAHNLFGLQPDGGLVAEQSTMTLFDDFLRAVDAGVYEGDPTRLVVYPYGNAGGSGVNEWLEVAQAVWGAREEIGSAIATGIGFSKFVTWVRNQNHERQAKRLARNANLPAAMRKWLADHPAFSTEAFVKTYPIEAAEAADALRRLGYLRGEDELWRHRSPQLDIDISQWIGGHDAFSTDAFAAVFALPEVEARLLLVGFGLRRTSDGLWRHQP